MSSNFIHLHIHSEFSIIDGIVRIPQLIKKCTEDENFAVAISDHMNLFSAVKFYKAATGAGIKPIISAEVWIHDKTPHALVLLCQNNQGYKNLTELISKAYVEGQINGKPYLSKEWLTPESTTGLIALSAASDGNIGQALLKQDNKLAETALHAWQKLFPDRFYLELQRVGKKGEEQYIDAAVELAAKFKIPVVATNNVRFVNPDDFEAHEARTCIHDSYVLADTRRPHRFTEKQYLRSSQEMTELFVDLPSALENTVEIAKRCNVELQLYKNFLPNFPVPEGQTTDEYFREVSQKGLETRLDFLFPNDKADKRKPYDDRLTRELDVIVSMGFSGYFLIVADFIEWSLNNGVPVGPGRGSGAGSLVAYALNITNLDPLAYDLLFERFLNPERVSMPDFDIDFCMEGRDRVIEYVAQKYGRESVSQIITYGTMAARAVVRDVGRVLNHGYGFVDKLAKLIPFEIGMTLEKALEQEEVLYERYHREEEVKTLLNLAKKLEGITRNAGKHAGGVVIAPSKLTDFSPLYCEADGSNLVTQFDKDDVETVGLVKFDFLGLRTLTIINWAVQNIKNRKNNPETIDIDAIPLDDEASFKILKDCNTTAVFQLESRGMKDLIRRLQPDCFEEIIALVALFRPGPLQSGMVDDFINRKHGRALVEYDHPLLESILQPTYGVILYQEQVMQIAQVMAGYTLGAADMLRRAMGKKKPEEMAKQRDIFVEGSKKNNIDKATSTAIFDLMEKFAGYGFNKSHSAAYALVAYQTAWLKAHYPAEFMAAVLSSDMDNTDKVVNFLDDCKINELKIIPPNINQGLYKFSVSENNEIIFGIGAIKGVGEAAIQCIIDEREKAPFTDLFDFCNRVDLRKVNKRVFEALIRSGAMDELGPHRACLLQTLPSALKAAEQASKDQTSGQTDLFGHEVAKEQSHEFVNLKPWTDRMRLQGEKETLGFYLTGHPINEFVNEFKHIISTSIVQINPYEEKPVTVAGLILSIRTLFTKRGDKMAIVTIDDGTEKMDLTLFSEVYEKSRHLLFKDNIIIAQGEAGIDDFNNSTRLLANEVFDLEHIRNQYARALVIKLKPEHLKSNANQHLKDILGNYTPGGCQVIVEYLQDTNTQARIALGPNWRIKPQQELLDQLYEAFEREQVTMEYL